MTHLRMSTLITIAVFFLLVGTFLSVTVQGIYQILFAIPLVFYMFRAKGRSFKLPASSWWLLAFCVVALVSIALNWSDIPKPSKNLGRVKYFLMAAFGIFPLGVWLKHVSDRTKRRLLRVAAIAFAVGGYWCAWQVLVQGVWKAKPLIETMRYCYGTALVFVLGSGLFLHRNSISSWFSWRWGLLALSGLFCGVLFTQARGAQGAILLAIPWVIFFWDRKIGMAALLFGALAGGFLLQNYFYGNNAKSTIKILRSSNNSSDGIRSSQWKAALYAWKEKPVFGWGLSNFHTQVNRIKNQYDLPVKEYNDAHAHNVPLEIAAGTGTVGLLLFLGWFFAWAWECWQAGGLVRALMMPLFIALAFEAQFEVILDANNATWISFLYALTLARDKRFQIPFA